MELGLNAIPLEADEWYWRDLGVTWCKWSADIDQEAPADDRARLERAAELGVRVVTDLRTSSQKMNTTGMEAYQHLAQTGGLVSLAEGADADEQEQVIRENQRRAQACVHEVIADQVQRHVLLHKDLCQDWEWWGEWDCPVTSAGIFHIICYPATLQTVYKAIKEVQPEARVWTGGNGMDLHDGWVIGLQRDGALKSFDVLNWHPYPMTLRSRSRIEERLHENYSGWRETLDREGLGQPFATTEWGYPSLERITQQQREWLESRVVEGGISQLYAEEALEAYAGDLRIMEEHGFEVVIVHTLRDSKSRHWGERSGLLTLTGEKKPIYDLVKEAAWKGRAGKKAFALVPAPENPKRNDTVQTT